MREKRVWWSVMEVIGAPPWSVPTKVDAVIIFIVIILFVWACVCVYVYVCVCVCVLSCVERGGSSRRRCVKVEARRAIYEPSALHYPLGAFSIQLLMEISWMTL